MRAVVFGFGESEGTVLREQFAVPDDPRAGSLTIGTGLRLVRGVRLPGGGLLGELASDPATHLVGAVLDGGEIEVVDLLIGPEDVPRDHLEDLLEPRVENAVRQRGAEHVGLP